MRVPGFNAEVTLGRLSGNYASGCANGTARGSQRVAPAFRRVGGGDIDPARTECWLDCIGECNGYHLDTPVNCSIDCYKGCVLADPAPIR